MTEWILYQISEAKESRNGSDQYFILSFFNTETKTRAYTYITVGYRNNEWWAPIIIDQLYGIYTFKSIQTKQEGNRLLINGDSIPQLVNESTQEEAQIVVDLMGGPRTTYASVSHG